MTNTKYSWVPFYEELADKLYTFKSNRTELIQKVIEAHQIMGIKLPKLESDNEYIPDIDPFTVFALFNRGKQSVATRQTICEGYQRVFNMDSSIPSDFDGVPMFFYNQYCFYRYVNDSKRDNKCFEYLWNLFEQALFYSNGKENAASFIDAFEQVMNISLVGLSKLTIGLFHIRPNVFVNLDSKNIAYVEKNLNQTIDDLSGTDYVALCSTVLDYCATHLNGSLPAFSALAYETFQPTDAVPADNGTPKSEQIESDKSKNKDTSTMIDKNTILYGPPGTGKTYYSAIYAVAIIENKDISTVSSEPYSAVMKHYKEYKENGQIEFTTFHQSYGYEEFIEGIRPIMPDDYEDGESHDIQYKITPGLFKAFCDKAGEPVIKKNDNLGINDNPTIWKVSLEGTGDNPTRSECLEKGHIRIGYDEYGEVITDETVFAYGGKNVLNAFISKMKIGDIVFSCYSAATIDAIGVVIGDYEWHDEYAHYKRLRKVRWLAKGINEDITKINAGKTMTLPSTYELGSISIGDAMALINRVAPNSTTIEDKQKNYVFIIDEINRGNIAKIFGELITLIEPSKRIGCSEEIRAKLPYSPKPFGVPNNVYILGTMNTADRSIATLDTALRRRFSFKEMLPDPSLLHDVVIDGLSISTLLSNLNQKIIALYDREHTIGHAYFLPLKDKPSIENLASIFENKIIPLLQEYFYEDYEKIRLVLGDNRKESEDLQFVPSHKTDYYKLFGDSGVDYDDSITYEINSRAFHRIEAYQYI